MHLDVFLNDAHLGVRLIRPCLVEGVLSAVKMWYPTKTFSGFSISDGQVELIPGEFLHAGNYVVRMLGK